MNGNSWFVKILLIATLVCVFVLAFHTKDLAGISALCSGPGCPITTDTLFNII